MKRKKTEEGGSDWMGTYGDMVTLLLCFFVLLYSISSVDQAKWVNLVKSMNPDAKEVSQLVTDKTLEPGNENVPGSTDAKEKFEQIAEDIQKEMDKMGIDADVKVTKGDGFQFISYKDKVFFDGDSPILKDEGKKVLDGLCKAVRPAAKTIKQIKVMGHTSQERPDRPNNVVTDRVLAAERSARVVAYIQENKILNDPAKLVSEGYGQFHPIAPFDTAKQRAKNRRAEILITEDGSTQKTLNDYYDSVYGKKKEE